MLDQIFDPETRSEFPPTINQPEPTWRDWLAKYKYWLIGWLVFMIVGLGAAWWFVTQNGNGDMESNNVVLLIKGPEMLASGNEADYRIIYKNGENADLINLSLEVIYPPNFKFKSADPAPASASGQRFDLPLLRQGQEGQVVIRGQVSGSAGDSKDIKAKLLYRMSNFNSEFAVEQQFTTILTAPNLELEITGPIEVTNGQDSSFSVYYRNVSGQDYDSAALQLAYPEGFKFTASNPPPGKDNNYWTLGKLVAGSNGKIDINGSFVGDPGMEKMVQAELGLLVNNNFAPQISSSAGFKIVPSSLTVSQEALPDKVVGLGQTITYTLDYANYGTTGMTNVVITAVLDGAMLDLAQLRATNGIVTNNTITWKAATLSNLSLLSPNQKGEITFTARLKSSISTNLKNQTIRSAVSIYSDQIEKPVRGADLEVKLGSNLEMIVNGQYVSGAAPMAVGQTTVFNITVLLTNGSNDLTDVVLTASLPLPASAWKNIIVPEAEKSKVTFDVNASKIRWKVGGVPAFTGRFSQAKSLTFQLHVTPTEANRGQSMLLLKDIQATGTDDFTTLNVGTVNLSELRVNDLDDDVMQSKGVTVQ